MSVGTVLSEFPLYATGTRTGIAELAPHLIGEYNWTRRMDILKSTASKGDGVPLNQRMDPYVALKGHPYVKSAIDMACWDILGKVSKPIRGLAQFYP